MATSKELDHKHLVLLYSLPWIKHDCKNTMILDHQGKTGAVDNHQYFGNDRELPLQRVVAQVHFLHIRRVRSFGRLQAVILC